MERGVSVCVPSAPYSSSTPNRSNPSATLYTHPVQYALGHPAPPPAHSADTSVTAGTHFAIVGPAPGFFLFHVGRPKEVRASVLFLDVSHTPTQYILL